MYETTFSVSSRILVKLEIISCCSEHPECERNFVSLKQDHQRYQRNIVQQGTSLGPPWSVKVSPGQISIENLNVGIQLNDGMGYLRPD